MSNFDFNESVISDDAFVPQGSQFVGYVIDLSVGNVSASFADAGDQQVEMYNVNMIDMTQDPQAPRRFRTDRFKKSRHPMSSWMRWIEEAKKRGVNITSVASLKGKFFLFEEVSLTWDNFEGSKRVNVPVQEMSRDQVVQWAMNKYNEPPFFGDVDAEVGSPTTTNTTDATELLVLNLLDGKDYTKFMQSAISNTGVSSNNTLLAQLVDPSHAYVNALVSRGLCTVDASGVYHKA